MTPRGYRLTGQDDARAHLTLIRLHVDEQPHRLDRRRSGRPSGAGQTKRGRISAAPSLWSCRESKPVQILL